jgi:septum site-determining protein MinC
MIALTQTTIAADAPLPSVQFRGGLFTLMVLRVGNPRDQAFFTALLEKVSKTPDFFRHAPIVLDLRELNDAPPFNMAELVRRLRQHQLVPVGVQHGTDEQNKAAVNCGLSLMPGGGTARDVPAIQPTANQTAHQASGGVAAPQPAGPAAAPVQGSGTLVVDRPVRSGSQVYARQADLIVLAPISHGAELLADGHIHVYGPLRGRAHAGVSGDEQARVFCHSLDAELVSIAGRWRVRDDIPEDLIGRPVQVSLAGERLAIEPLG